MKESFASPEDQEGDSPKESVGFLVLPIFHFPAREVSSLHQYQSGLIFTLLELDVFEDLAAEDKYYEIEFLEEDCWKEGAYSLGKGSETIYWTMMITMITNDYYHY